MELVRKEMCLLSEENVADFENFMVCFYSCSYCVVLIPLCHILGNKARLLHVLCVQSTTELNPQPHLHLGNGGIAGTNHYAQHFM